MREQLENFALEMIQEIKDLKDLTKKELPEIAKEYIRYNVQMATVGMVISALFCLMSVVLAIGAYSYEDRGWVLGPGSLVVGLFGFVGIFSCGGEYMRFTRQPRRMAIEAIRTLIK